MEQLALTTAVLLVKGAVEGLGDSAGRGVANLVRRITAVVARRFGDDSAAAQAWEHAREAPADEERIAALASHLARHIADDEAFAQALRAMLAEARNRPDTSQAVITIQDSANVGKIASFGVVNGDVTF